MNDTKRITLQCSVEGCTNRHLAKSLCSHHYQRLRRHGDPMGRRVRLPTVEDWLRGAALATQDACLPFPFFRDRDSYGRFQRRVSPSNRKPQFAHSFVCEIVHGPPPTVQHCALHSCDNPACVNPRHLRWGTRRDNSRDMVKRGRQTRGERNPAAKLSEEDVLDIRAALAEESISQSHIARRFGISRTVVSYIKNRKLWEHVK